MPPVYSKALQKLCYDAVDPKAQLVRKCDQCGYECNRHVLMSPWNAGLVGFVCILCEMWFIPRQDVSADAQKRIFEQRRADVEFLSQLQVDLKVDQLQPTHLDKSRFLVHGYNEPELWYILSSEQRLFGREMFIAGESKPISDINTAVTVISNGKPSHFTWVVWPKTGGHPEYFKREYPPESHTTHHVSLEKDEFMTKKYIWYSFTQIQVWSEKHGGWQSKRVGDLIDLRNRDRILVKGPGVGAVRGFFAEGMRMEGLGVSGPDAGTLP